MEDLKHIWTVGHSQRTLEEFTRLLLAFNIGAVADVRRYPISARFPHFNEMHLFKSLTRLDIEYEAFTNLGGRRRPHCDSPNLLLHNESFRGYADYMLTEPFHEGIERLVELAGQKRTAILCSEALWWRCHRSMIADYLKAKDFSVTHIFTETWREPHRYTSAARIVDGKPTYAPQARELELAH